MAIIPEHSSPISKQDTLDTWRKEGRISLPSRGESIVDVIIVSIYECTAVDGQPLDFLIEARTTLNDPIKRFGVVFSDRPPDKSQYSIPILWRRDGHSGVGVWC